MDGLQEHYVVTPIGTFTRTSQRTFTHLVVGRYVHQVYMAFHWVTSEASAREHVSAHLRKAQNTELYPLAELLIVQVANGKVLSHIKTRHFDGLDFTILSDGDHTSRRTLQEAYQ